MSRKPLAGTIVLRHRHRIYVGLSGRGLCVGEGLTKTTRHESTARFESIRPLKAEGAPIVPLEQHPICNKGFPQNGNLRDSALCSTLSWVVIRGCDMCGGRGALEAIF